MYVWKKNHDEKGSFMLIAKTSAPGMHARYNYGIPSNVEYCIVKFGLGYTLRIRHT
jgi:hypothetical protein